MTKKQTKKIKTNLKKSRLPKIKKGKGRKDTDFPLDYYSHSSLSSFTTNPILFKIKYINKDRYETAISPAFVVGKAFHLAMETYYGSNPELKPKNESDAIKMGLEVGMTFLEEYSDGFINYTTTIQNKQKMYELFSFGFNAYVKEKPYKTEEKILGTEEKIEEFIDVNWKGRQMKLPVKLKGFLDKIIRTKDGKIKIIDYKTTRSFSDPEKIDGFKILQAIQYYFLTYAKFGEEPYSMTYEEVKLSKNRNGENQVKEYEIKYHENELYFDFYFRLYEDVTKAINGEMVWVPNIQAMFDNEVAMISYIHRLDDTEIRAKEMKRLKVDNITDLLKKKIEKASNLNKFLKTAEKSFITAKSINYEDMQTEEKIATKFMEYGVILKFEKIIKGNTVNVYCYNPSIGVKMSKIRSYVDDVELITGKTGIRILAPIPNTTMVGFEVPADERKFPNLPRTTDGFNMNIGVNAMGEKRTYDIRQAPHMLVAGSTGSGKSVFLNAIIKQLIKNDRAELHLYDPKQVELFQYEEMVEEYLHNAESINLALQNLVQEMEARYSILRKARKRNIEEIKDMKYKFIIIDEYADLVIKEDIEKNIQLLAQKGRACGIHIIIATQRASTKIISGDIKINFPVKVVFRMSKEVDSRVMIDEAGAEKLLGKGDCLFTTDTGIERLQAYNI